MEKRKEIHYKRTNNFMILKNKLNSQYFFVPRSFEDSLKFKYVFTINSDVIRLKEFILNMKKSGIEIHHCSRTNTGHTQGVELKNFHSLKNNLLEISTESSIPEENFQKAAEIMNSYFKNS